MRPAPPSTGSRGLHVSLLREETCEAGPTLVSDSIAPFHQLRDLGQRLCEFVLKGPLTSPAECSSERYSFEIFSHRRSFSLMKFARRTRAVFSWPRGRGESCARFSARCAAFNNILWVFRSRSESKAARYMRNLSASTTCNRDADRSFWASIFVNLAPSSCLCVSNSCIDRTCWASLLLTVVMNDRRDISLSTTWHCRPCQQHFSCQRTQRDSRSARRLSKVEEGSASRNFLLSESRPRCVSWLSITSPTVPFELGGT